ncbi:MAG TPA: hypothetical protein VNI52_08690 [Sphingobacteriaceae bacterium]|nr:hypothetical protein [Sphingobacteriaceae bacterium]
MASIIIHTDNQKDLTLLQELAQKMGFKAQILTNSHKEDFVIAKSIEENNAADLLSFEEAKSYYQTLTKSEK